MKIKHRLMITYGLLVILSFIIVMGNSYTLKTMESDSNLVNYLGKIRVTNYKMAQLANVFVNNQDNDVKHELEKSMKKFESLMVILLEGDQELGIPSLKNKDTIEKLYTIENVWNSKYKTTYNNILNNADLNSLEFINKDIDAYVEFIDEMVTSHSEDSSLKVDNAKTLNKVTFLITIIIGMVSLYTINKGIKRPIDLLMKKLKETSFRDSNFTDEFELVSKNEISQMGDYFNELVYDSLTRVYNRGSGLGRLGRTYENDKLRQLNMSLCFIDINGLKEVNDLLGHSYGDELIISSVDSIKSVIRDDDYIIRLGGDEFLIVFKDINKETAEIVWNRILNIYEKINKEENRSYIISISHGIVEFNYDLRHDLDNLIKEADEKMYLEKREMKTDLTTVRKDK